MVPPPIKGESDFRGVIWSKGLSIRNREPVHTLRNLPGKFSGLELLCLEYAGFQRIDPSVDIGIDLSAEYGEARRSL